MNSFSQRCYTILRKVPEGKVTTYKALAHALHSKAYRAVGNAMNKNPHAPFIPCHRVIKSNGDVGGFAHTVKKKILLLRKEGIKIKYNKVDLSIYEYLFKGKKKLKPHTLLFSLKGAVKLD